MSQYELPIVYGKSPIEGNTTSEYFKDPKSKNGKHQLTAININSPITIQFPRADIKVEQICVIYDGCGQFKIQLCEEDGDDAILYINISEYLVDTLKYAITQYKEIKPTNEEPIN